MNKEKKLPDMPSVKPGSESQQQGHLSSSPSSSIPSLTSGLKLIKPPTSSSTLGSPTTLLPDGASTTPISGSLSGGSGNNSISSSTLPPHVQEILAQANNFSSPSLLGSGSVGSSLYNHNLDGGLSFSTSTTATSLGATTSPQYLASMGLPQDLLPSMSSSLNQLQTPSSQQQQPQQQIPDFSKIATTPPPLNPVVGPSFPNMGMMAPSGLATTAAAGGYHDLPPIFNHPPPSHVMTSESVAVAAAAAAAAGMPSGLSRANLPPQLAAAYMQQQYLKSQQQQPHAQHPVLPSAGTGMQDLNLSGKRQPPVATSELSFNLLQRMQMQRRAERKEYQERRLIDENWPGFGGMVGGNTGNSSGVDPDSLWDHSGMSTEADNQWVPRGAGGLHHPGNVSGVEDYDNSIWSSGGTGATIWSPVGTSSSGSRWFEGPDGFMAGGGGNAGSAGDLPSAPPMQQGPPVVPQPGGSGAADNNQVASSMGLFNPFDSMRNIWGQHRSATDSATLPGMVAPGTTGGSGGGDHNPSLEAARRSHMVAANEAMIMEHGKQQMAMQQMQVNDDARMQQQLQQAQEDARMHQMHMQQAGEDARLQQMQQVNEDIRLQQMQHASDDSRRQTLPKWSFPEAQ